MIIGFACFMAGVFCGAFFIAIVKVGSGQEPEMPPDVQNLRENRAK